MHTYVVDNDSVLLFLMKKLIQRTGFDDNPKFFDKGEEALKSLQQEYNEDDVFAIFLDINMPEMSGWEFLDELEKFASVKNTLVFMISSSVDRSDIEKANAHVFITKYLEKPIEDHTLLELKAWIEARLSVN